MQELLLDNDTLLTDDTTIMIKLVWFYKDLFANDLAFNNNQATALHTLLQSIHQTLSTKQIKCLEKTHKMQTQ